MFNSVDKIIKSFSKLEARLDKHITSLNDRDDLLFASQQSIATTRKSLQAEVTRAARIKDNIQKLIK